ncbi:MAG: phosphatidylglycerophosphatase A [Phycisphaerae bacterium]|jgi:phosphatidylglycerophosphatase A
MWITTFGLGAMRPAPGTWGSLPPVVAAGLLWALECGPNQSPWLFNGVQATFLATFSIACIAQGDRAEAHFGRKDPSHVVADETAGQSLALMLLPPVAFADPMRAALTLAIAFLSFRILDIIKPWPARGLQRVPGGWGILIDDLIAGFYAAVATQLAVRWMWIW